MSDSTSTAVLGGGCFWCTEAFFKELPGVLSVESGYAGGHIPNPTYEQVCSGRTGHAEVIRVTYDPAKISYGELLEAFWKTHDPTTLNRQGNDVGTQYRSIILTGSAGEAELAKASKEAARAAFRDPIVTEIIELDTFYPAEVYHQDFSARNPGHPYVCALIAPKVRKFRASIKG